MCGSVSIYTRSHGSVCALIKSRGKLKSLDPNVKYSFLFSSKIQIHCRTDRN